MRLFLCDARRQIRSIVNLCEEFGVRRTRAKRTHQNDFTQGPRRYRPQLGEYSSLEVFCSSLAYA